MTAPKPTGNWTPLVEAMPPSKVLLEVITPGGDKRPLIYADGLWWLPDMSAYVHFTPTCWRPADQAPAASGKAATP